MHFKTQTAILQLLEDGIIRMKSHTNLPEEELDTIKENWEQAFKMRTKNENLLIVPQPNSIITKEAREYIEKNVKKFAFVAVVSEQLAQRLIANFIMKTKRNKNMRLFKTEGEALEWLRSKA